MNQLCRIMRKHNVMMTSHIRDKLMKQDHMLDEHYVTIRITTQKTVTEEVTIDPSEQEEKRRVQR